MDEFTLYAYNFRSRSERVLWTLRELDLPHKVIRLDPFKGETNTPEFLELNPTRKLPVLVQGDTVLTESMAIMEYLNEISEQQQLLPTSAALRYQCRRLIHYGETEIEPYLWITEQVTSLSKLYRWPEGTYKDAISLAQQNIDALWPMLGKTDYIAGSSFTLADIYFYQIITWAGRYKIQCPTEFKAYMKRLENRPAFPVEMQGG